MDKRTFLKYLSISTASAIGGSWLAGCQDNNAEAPTVEIPPKVIKFDNKNWMWFRPKPNETDDHWKAIFEKAKNAGIDAVLPQIYGGNGALFQHQNPLIESGADTLAQLIPLAHEAGLEIHAWMWTMICNNQNVIDNHPDWFAVNGLGEPAHTKPAYVGYYKFMCPSHPEVRAFVQSTVRSLAAYSELDGIHFDYVRLPDVILAEALQPKYDIVQDKEYPQYDYCYSDLCRNEFKAQTGIDPMELEDPSANEAWRQYRYDSVTTMVNDFLVPVAKAQNKQVTAAVFPNWESVRQQWQQWDLDGFLPMLYHNFYNEDYDWIKAQIEKNRALLKSPKPIYSGLFIPSIPPEELQLAIEKSMEGGANGYSIFDLNAMKAEHWKVLTNFVTNS